MSEQAENNNDPRRPLSVEQIWGEDKLCARQGVICGYWVQGRCSMGFCVLEESSRRIEQTNNNQRKEDEA